MPIPTVFKNNGIKLLLGLLCVCAILPQYAHAQGNLLMTPRRIIFDGAKKTQEINLANTGKDTATYLISMMEIRMTETGGFEEILQPDPGQNFASKYLRFFPRTVTLGPSEAQSVKVQLSKASQLPDGEYRSHIYFRAVPKATELGAPEEAKPGDSTISVNIKAVFGITAPVIIKIGTSTTEVKITDFALKTVNGIPKVNLTLNRTGNMSAYGDIIVNHISPNGKVTQAGAIRGVAVYSPIPKRKAEFDLSKDIDYKSGKLEVSYSPQPNDVKKGAPLTPFATAEISLK